MCCTAEDFRTNQEEETELLKFPMLDRNRNNVRCRAHHGMIEAAKGVAKATRRIIASELANNLTYDLVVVGHSLGSGVAAIVCA